MKKSEHIRNLFRKYLKNRITEEELKQLLEYFSLDEDKEILAVLIEQEMARTPDVPVYDERVSAIADSVERKLFEKKRPVRKLHSFRLAVAVAAMLILALTFALNWYFDRNKSPDNQTVSKVNDVLPGGNKAILTLANGEKIDLSTVQNGKLADQAGSVVNKNSKGEIAYTAADNNAVAKSYNLIQTPNGGEFQLRLPDGTRVWLNAESSLTYPTSFAALKDRQVELTGEAYFEVAHNKLQPFRVKTRTQNVEVLGTHFNIMAYTNESNIITTLLEGSVKIDKGNIYKILKPGQQSLTNEDIKIRDADIDAAVAWKNGRTYFRDADIPTIMRSVSRWYSIEVVYQGEIPHELFTGGISRKSNLSSLLKILVSGGIHASIEDHKLIVKP